MMRVCVSDVTVHHRHSTGARTTLSNVSLTVEPGERVGVMGPVGSGKSTLARLLRGLERPTSGRVIYEPADGDDDHHGHLARRLVLVPQRPEGALFTEDVRSELMFVPRILGIDVPAMTADAEAALAAVGLPVHVHADRDPLLMSGSEQRRVVIAAAIAARADVLVLDEPTAGLDARSRADVLNAIADEARRGATIICISHDAEDIRLLCDRLIVMGAGQVRFDGDPAVVLDDVDTARELGIPVSPTVALAQAIAPTPDIVADMGGSMDALAQVLAERIRGGARR